MPYQRADSPYYYLDFTPHGYDRRLRRSTGVKSKRTASAIEATLNRLGRSGEHRLLDLVADGEIDPRQVYAMDEAGRLDELMARIDNPPLSEICEDFKRTHPDERQALAMDRLASFAPVDARTSWLLDSKNVQRFVSSYKEAGLAPNTEHREMSGVRQLVRRQFGKAAQEEVFSKIKLRPQPKRRMRYLEQDEIEKVRAASGDWWLVFGLFIATGMRRGELVELQVRDVDLVKGSVTVEAGKSQRARRTVPIGGQVLESLREWVAENELGSSDPLFPDADYYRVYDVWREVCVNAGLASELSDAPPLHALRHTYAVHMARAGMPMPTLMKRLGHSNITTTMRYAEYAPEPQTTHDAEGLEAMGLKDSTPNSSHSEEAESPQP